jgi:UDP-galactopyranose mutase
MWTKADPRLIEQGKRELCEIGLLDDPSQVEAGYVVRMPKAYPMYDGTYKANVETLRKWIDANTPNVFPVGRNGMHKYNNQDHSMYTAMLSVENIFGANHDVWNVNVEAEYHEEKSAGDGAERDAASRGAGAATSGAAGREDPTT